MNSDIAMRLARDWAKAWSDLGLEPPPGVFEQILQAHGESHRHYHSIEHLIECLAHFEGARHLARQPGEVAIALWFHDAVYDVKGTSNEQRSADWATAVLEKARAPEPTCKRIEQLILATRHDALPKDADQQLLVDIDLAILGAPVQRFAEYDKQIRAEYNWVPGLLYGMKRKAVLKSFLARPSIYSTQHFRDRLEAQARANLTTAVT